MPLLLAVAALVVLALLLLRRGAGHADMPARMVAAAANRLPTGRRDWGQAMIAELPAVGAAVTTRHRAAGTKAGMLTVALSAPILFAINMTTVLSQRHYTLTDPYDISAFPHSGYPDVASYLISDALDGNIIAGLIVYPLALLVLAMLGAAIGTTLPNRGTRPTAPHITSG